MNKPQIPNLPLPASLLGSEAGSFTEYTVTQRMPDTARRVIKENKFPNEINQRLEELAAAIPSGYLQPLTNDTGADFHDWEKYLEPYKNQRWVDVPWFFAETYFYRLILNITNYFQPGKWQGIDPFALQKTQGLEASLDSIISLCTQVQQWLEESIKEGKPSKSSLIALLYFALWGNRVDLSLWSAFEDDRSSFDIQTQLTHILVDDSFAVTKLLTQSQNNRIDFVIDNAGFELICDLCLVDFLLGSGFATQVYLHLKPHPTFVSDAMIKDVYETKDFLTQSSHTQVQSLGQRLTENLASGRLVLTEDYFWTSPLPFWQIPQFLKDELAKSNLIVVKGDANYRRLLGDLHWDFTTKFADIVSYLPTPIVALRTLKSEVAAGLKADVLEELAIADPKWLTNGEWGVIQLVS
ncbi:protein-glutamate O-methyltransferase family protein [Sphaerospermopsis aphanizomenoides BCCUSP55]|uniref:damage-control phosphatase ARMT1 family protein n=1 Tax=Sphaerospermopsis aphanizomenoides TaxID=459663 RepID=UPI0019061B20|nr:damage-control phosphatase ARMT1 family protein [Sphaerospermopsis aphanizomenoides]MBK1986767.1 protein-glutamate O-methyltransferase family protein [Sphaerospermopsis aphanizomenoides BCCUSP55]